MMTERCITQIELTERWRTASAGPLFRKLDSQVRYSVQDVEALEEVAIRGLTKIDGGVDQTTVAIERPIYAASDWCTTFSTDHHLAPIWTENHRSCWSHTKKPSYQIMARDIQTSTFMPAASNTNAKAI